MLESRSALLDQSYNFLQSCRFQEAKEILDSLLEEEPHSGLILLGIFMAEKQIRGREELAQNWQVLRNNPDFLQALQAASPDFLPWLERDMSSLQKKMDNAQSSSPQTAAETDSFRKIVQVFTGIQIFLFLLVIFFVYRSFPEKDNPFSFLMSSFVVAMLLAGGTVILCPIYGKALMTSRKFARALKILGNILSGIGAPATALFSIVFFSSLSNASYEAVSDRYTFFAFFTAFCIHVLGLIFPRILEHIRPSS